MKVDGELVGHSAVSGWVGNETADIGTPLTVSGMASALFAPERVGHKPVRSIFSVWTVKRDRKDGVRYSVHTLNVREAPAAVAQVNKGVFDHLPNADVLGHRCGNIDSEINDAALSGVNFPKG